jgi:sialic acid synthase SpsE
LLIVEVGQNHMGNMSLAKEMVYQAKESGAFMVKFQLYDSFKLYGEKQTSELSRDDTYKLWDYCEGKNGIGINCMFSVFDLDRVQWCKDIGVKWLKIAYSKQSDSELIEACHKVVGDRLIVSTGIKNPITGVIKLYCVPKYPARVRDLMFGDIDFMITHHGFSDHTVGLEASKLALARGARYIEKHFCWNHSLGVDAPWSMDLPQLKELIAYEKYLDEVIVDHGRWME